MRDPNKYVSSKLTIKAKLISTFSIVFIFLLLLFSHSQTTIFSLSNSLNLITGLRVPTQQAGTRLKEGINKSQLALTSLIISKDKTYILENKKIWSSDINDSLLIFELLSKQWTNADNIYRFNVIKDLLEKYKNIQVNLIANLTSEKKINKLLFQEVFPIHKKIAFLINDLTINQQYLLSNEILAIDKMIKEHKAIQSTLVLLVLIITLGLIFITVSNINNSINKLKLAAYTLANNASKPILRTYVKDELSAVGLAMEKLALELYETRREETSTLKNDANEIIENTLDAVITIDEKGNILTFNQSAKKLFGYTFDEVRGKNIKLLMPLSFSDNHDSYLKNYVDTGNANIINVGREVKGLNKNNDIFPLHLSVVEISRTPNGMKRFVGFCHDLTKHDEQEKIIRQSQKMDAIGKLTGGVAHDFNNLLGIIIGYSELLKTKLGTTSQDYRYAKEISIAGERGASLIRKLLVFSKTTEDKKTVVDINQSLKGQYKLMEKATAKHIDFIFQTNEYLWPVKFNVNDFNDVILNMTINSSHALKGHAFSPTITFETDNVILKVIPSPYENLAAGDYVQIKIIDNGKGIDSSIIDKIFDPFFTSKGELGTGLGLSQAFGFVQKSLGFIIVTSKINEGTTFELYFPRHIEEIDNKTYEASSKSLLIESVELEKELVTVLLVEDEGALIEIEKEILEENGYKTLCASNGVEALDLLSKNKVDVLISDIIMPNMDGYHLAEIVLSKYPEVKIQFISGYTGQTEITYKKIFKNIDILYKPFTSINLIGRIKKLVANTNITN